MLTDAKELATTDSLIGRSPGQLNSNLRQPAMLSGYVAALEVGIPSAAGE